MNARTNPTTIGAILALVLVTLCSLLVALAPSAQAQTVHQEAFRINDRPEVYRLDVAANGASRVEWMRDANAAEFYFGRDWRGDVNMYYMRTVQLAQRDGSSAVHAQFDFAYSNRPVAHVVNAATALRLKAGDVNWRSQITVVPAGEEIRLVGANAPLRKLAEAYNRGAVFVIDDPANQYTGDFTITHVPNATVAVKLFGPNWRGDVSTIQGEISYEYTHNGSGDIYLELGQGDLARIIGGIYGPTYTQMAGPRTADTPVVGCLDQHIPEGEERDPRWRNTCGYAGRDGT